VGDTICATEHHIFFATGTSEGRNGEITGTWLARRDRADVASRKPELRIEIGLEIHGVAASSDHVFASTSDGRVRVFDHELKPIGDWPAPAPGEMAIDASGHLWIVDTESRSILHFDAQGNRLPQAIALLEDEGKSNGSNLFSDKQRGLTHLISPREKFAISHFHKTANFLSQSVKIRPRGSGM